MWENILTVVVIIGAAFWFVRWLRSTAKGGGCSCGKGAGCCGGKKTDGCGCGEHGH